MSIRLASNSELERLSVNDNEACELFAGHCDMRLSCYMNNIYITNLKAKHIHIIKFLGEFRFTVWHEGGSISFDCPINTVEFSTNEDCLYIKINKSSNNKIDERCRIKFENFDEIKDELKYLPKTDEVTLNCFKNCEKSKYEDGVNNE